MSQPDAVARSSAESVTARSRLASPFVALVLGGSTLLFLFAVVPLSVAAHQFTAGDVLPVLVTIPFAGVGVLVAYRQPRNPIGWILLVLALVVTVGGDAGFYALRAYRVDGHGLPLSRLAVALAPGWIALIALLPLPVLLFPDGRLPERFWRSTLWAYIVMMASSRSGSASSTQLRSPIDVSASIPRASLRAWGATPRSGPSWPPSRRS